MMISMLALLPSCKKAPLGALSDCVIDTGINDTEMNPELVAADADGEEKTVPRVCNLENLEKSEESNLEISITLRKFSTKQEIKMREALRRLKIVVNSEEFRIRVLDHEYKNEYTFVDNDDLTNEEIYEKLMAGAETLSPEVDEEMDIDFTMYYKRNNVVGYTYPSTQKIWVNSRFFNSANYGKIAANAIHEWSHKVGFGHSYKNNSRRPFSVPYGIGTIIKDLVNAM
jgi:hypothetical protein